MRILLYCPWCPEGFQSDLGVGSRLCVFLPVYIDSEFFGEKWGVTTGTLFPVA